MFRRGHGRLRQRVNAPDSGADETEPIIERRGLQQVQVDPSGAAGGRSAAPGPVAALELRRSASWLQLLAFCVVGSTGYAINLAVYTVLLAAGVAFAAAAVCSFLAAVANNYTLNRVVTFRDRRGDVVTQGTRYLSVSVAALGANLGFLTLLVHAGLGEVPAQAAAIVLVTPLSFLGNKLWSFGR